MKFVLVKVKVIVISSILMLPDVICSRVRKHCKPVLPGCSSSRELWKLCCSWRIEDQNDDCHSENEKINFCYTNWILAIMLGLIVFGTNVLHLFPHLILSLPNLPKIAKMNFCLIITDDETLLPEDWLLTPDDPPAVDGVTPLMPFIFV